MENETLDGDSTRAEAVEEKVSLLRSVRSMADSTMQSGRNIWNDLRICEHFDLSMIPMNCCAQALEWSTTRGARSGTASPGQFHFRTWLAQTVKSCNSRTEFGIGQTKKGPH